ncbi:MAG TPA: hypothetical protein VHL60_00900 [Oxalicibacterium sp.]|nr:hypothetical protein [Oxalicibacterium sp.]
MLNLARQRRGGQSRQHAGRSPAVVDPVENRNDLADTRFQRAGHLRNLQDFAVDHFVGAVQHGLRHLRLAVREMMVQA